eukprot:205757-Amphidinium_carterae.1
MDIRADDAMELLNHLQGDVASADFAGILQSPEELCSKRASSSRQWLFLMVESALNEVYQKKDRRTALKTKTELKAHLYGKSIMSIYPAALFVVLEGLGRNALYEARAVPQAPSKTQQAMAPPRGEALHEALA